MSHFSAVTQTGQTDQAAVQAKGAPTSIAPGASTTAPDDRATSFQAVEGSTETRSGATLMVEAYAVIWTILMVWLVMLWRKQNNLSHRLDGLEHAIDRAAAKASGGGVPPRPRPPEAPNGRGPMTPEHVIFIPSVLLIGIVLGYIMGARAARADAERRRKRIRE